MLDNIGIIAGEIWHYLEKNKEVSVGKLTQELKQTDRMILLGLGWLAREGKLKIENIAWSRLVSPRRKIKNRKTSKSHLFHVKYDIHF